MRVLTAAKWRATVDRHFRFLTDEYHMSVIATDDATNWETSVTYASDPSAVIIRYSIEFDRAEVELVRMVDHKVPRVPIFIHSDTSIDRALLDDLLQLRAPVQAEELKALGGLERKAVERSLIFQARALRQLGRDFLSGESDVFQDFDRMIKGRVAGNPQKLTISFPEGTPTVEVEQGVARAQAVDPRIPVEVKFYRRPVTTKKTRKWLWRRRGADSDG
jgi:hypothetical protein